MGLLSNTVGGLISNLFTNNQNYKSQTKINQQNYEYNKALSELAYNQNVEMWNMQNSYNSPSAQMARLKQAGLNPNLVYGSGSVDGNTTSDAPQLEYPTVDAKASQFVDPMGNMMSGMQIGLQQQMQSSQIKLLDAQALKTLSETKGIKIDNYIKDMTKDAEVSRISRVADQVLASTQLMKSHYRLNEQNRLWIDELNSSLLRMRDMETQHTEESMYKIATETWQIGELTPAQKALLEAESRTQAMRLLEIQASIAELNARAGLQGEQSLTQGSLRDLYKSEKDYNEAKKLYQDYANWIEYNTRDVQVEMAKWNLKAAKQLNTRQWIFGVAGSVCDIINTGVNAYTGGISGALQSRQLDLLGQPTFSYTDPRGITQNWIGHNGYGGYVRSGNTYNYTRPH